MFVRCLTTALGTDKVHIARVDGLIIELIYESSVLFYRQKTDLRKKHKFKSLLNMPLSWISGQNELYRYRQSAQCDTAQATQVIVFELLIPVAPLVQFQ